MESFCFSHIDDELHLNFANSRVDDYIGNNTVAIIDSYCDGSNNAEVDGLPLVVAGRSGVGKSAAIANWLQRRKAGILPARGLGYEEFVFSHVIGCSRLSTTIFHLLRRLITNLIRHFDLKAIDLADDEKLPWILPRLLERAAKKGKVIIVIDGGLQHICSHDQSYGLKWLPLNLPPNVKMILSVTVPCENPPRISDHATNLQLKICRTWEELQRRQWPTIVMKEFETGLVTALVNKYIDQTDTESTLKSQLANPILSLKHSRNAYFLTTILRGVCHTRQCLGFKHTDVMQCVDFWAASSGSMDLIERMLIVFESGIPRMDEEDHHPVPRHTLETHEATRLGTLLGQSLSLLFVARHGLREDELLDLLSHVRENHRWKSQTKDTVIPVKLKILESIMKTKHRLIDIFRNFDADGNGILSHEEFYQGMQRLNLKGVTHEEVTMLIDEVDNNGDGEIDFMETLDHFDDLSRRFLHGARRGSVFGNPSAAAIISKDKNAFTDKYRQNLITALQCVGVVSIDIGKQGRILTLPFENATLRDVVWKKYIRTTIGEAKSRAFITEYFHGREPSLRMCEELLWQQKKTNDLIGLKSNLLNLCILDTMYNTEELKPELFIYLCVLAKQQGGKFDIVIEYNRSVERWYSKSKPSSSTAASMVAFLADVMRWYSRNISKHAKLPPFMRAKLDADQLHKLGIEWASTDGNKVEKCRIHYDTDYFFHRWVWVQCPWLALSSASKAIAQHDNEPRTREESIASLPKEITGADSPSSGNVSVRARAMVNVAIQKQTLLKIDKIKPVETRRKTPTEIPFSSKAKRHSVQHVDSEQTNKPINKDELSIAYSKLSQVRDIYDSVVVEASTKAKHLKELEGMIEIKSIGDDQNSRRLAANERIISELELRLDQIYAMNDKATCIQSVYEQILVILQSCQPSLSTKHLELSQQITLSKQQISDILAQQDSIDCEISRIRTSSKKILTSIQTAVEERQNDVQPQLETLQRKVKDEIDRKKHERIASSFDPSAFSYRMKIEGIMAKRRMRGNNGNESKLLIDTDHSSSLHPMEKISLISGSLDPLDIVKKMKASELLAKDLSIKQERSELHTKQQRDTLDALEKQIKNLKLTDRAEPRQLDALIGQDSISDLDSLIQSRHFNLKQLKGVIKRVDLAAKHLNDMAESIQCEVSKNNQLNSFLFAMGERKFCMSEDVEKLIKAVQLIRNSICEEGEIPLHSRNPHDANGNAARSKDQRHEIHNESFMSRESGQKFNPNTRVLNKSARESVYIEVTKKLHEVEDEKYGDDGGESDREHDSERDFDKLSQYVRQSRTNASDNERRRANTLCRASQKHKGLILEAVLQHQSL